jgi:hypothetical protein
VSGFKNKKAKELITKKYNNGSEKRMDGMVSKW